MQVRLLRPWLAASAFLVPCPRLLVLVALLVCSSVASAQGGPQLPPLPASTADLPDVVARINDDPITKRELLAQAQTMRLQALQAGAEDPAQTEDFLPFVLEALIGERLVFADSLGRGVGASDPEVDARVEEIIAAYGGVEAFEKAMVAQGLDRQYIRRQVKQGMTIDKLMEGEIIPQIKVADEAVQEYYDRFSKEMKVPATYRVRHIMKVPPQGSGEDARVAARTQLEGLRQQITEGADFAALAKEHSDDQRTREQGGEMPWIALSGREGNFEPAVAQLEVNELSGVVETPAGLHLIQLLEQRPARIRTLEEARDEIGNILAAYEARQEIQRRVADLRTQAKIEILM